jgi:PAS domain S-box-containing protein
MEDPSMNAPSRLAEWIVEQTTDALIYVDVHGTIVRWNAAASTLFGFGAGEAIGQSVDLIIPERLRAAHWAGFDKAVAAGCTRLAGRPSLTRAEHKDGRKLYVEMTFALVKDDSGQVVGSVAIARDVTERVERERAARPAKGPG